MKTSFKKTIVSLLGVAALGLTVMQPAEAARIVGRWDPLYGAPFDNLGWAGEATFEVNDCFFTLGSGTFLANKCGGAGSVSVVSARVDLYDNDRTDDSILESLTWSAGSAGLPSVYALTFDGGMVTGVTTGLFAWRSPTSSFEDIDDYDFALFFLGDSVFLKNRTLDCYHFWHHHWCGYKYGINDFKDNPPENFSFTRLAVPEPQTFALLMVGFAALGFSTRLRRRQS